jgi:uncharacterized cupin superfamily protein
MTHGGVREARLDRTDAGLVPADDGWFVLNAADAPWWRHDLFGASCYFEGEPEFPEYGVRVKVLWPGQPNGMYHAESVQEDFLVVAGECLLLIEGEERPLRAWDFVHCPAETEHIFVGAGSGPCVIVMVGSRAPHAIRYVVSDLALRYGAGVEEETAEPDEAYVRFPGGETGPVPEGALPSLWPGK